MEEKNLSGQGDGQQKKNSYNKHRPRHYYNKNKDQKQNPDKVIKTTGGGFITDEPKDSGEVKASKVQQIPKSEKQSENRQKQANGNHHQQNQEQQNQSTDVRNGDGKSRNDDRKRKNNKNHRGKQNQPRNEAKELNEANTNRPAKEATDAQNKSERNDRNKFDKSVANQRLPETTKSLLDSIPENDDIFGKAAFSFGTPIQKPSMPKKAEEEVVIPQLSDEELFGVSHMIYTPKPCEEPSTEIVGVRFKSAGKVYYFDPDGIKFNVGDNAIVDTARGFEFGEVYVANKKVSDKDIIQPLRKVIRVATNEDIEHYSENRIKEAEAFKICLEKIANHKLDMKLVEVQYAFDNSKLLFYFTSAGRVDFRELVRDLASVFKTRIELRQIGIRDEAKLLGGIGMCGRPLCCSKCLSNFAQVSIKMAKEQGLSLNSNKISGNCGRLMCCLNFENQVYVEEIKNTPMPGSIVKVDGERGIVTEAHPLTGMLKVHLNSAEEGENITVHRDSVTTISKKNMDSATENDDKSDDLSE